MKKKLLNIFMIFVFVLSCGFLTACGSRYKNMEFDVQYAFVDENGDVGQWSNAGQTLSLNFGHKLDDLKFDEYGNANLVFKINIKNVKAKYIDDLIVYDGNSLSSKIVKQDETFSLNINGTMSSSIRIYETKSGKETSFRLNIFESLKNITTNYNYKPAIVVGQTVKLNKLVSANQSKSVLIFDPINTNQTAVNFSIVDFGYYDDDQNWVAIKDAAAGVDFAKIENGELQVKSNYNASLQPVIRIKASSALYEGEDEISSIFDVFVIENLNSTNAPVLTESPDTTAVVSEKTLYVNDEVESKFKLYAGIDNIDKQYSSKYIDGVVTATGEKAHYGLNVYVDGKLIDINDNNYHGIRIQLLKQASSKDEVLKNLFQYEISADENTYLTYPKSTIKFELSVYGLDYVEETPKYSASINIIKRSIVKNVTLNGETSATYTSGEVYSTTNSSAGQTGLNLIVDVTPNDNMSHWVLISATDGLTLTGNSIVTLEHIQKIGDYDYTMAVINGSSINVNFANTGAVAGQLRFVTLKKANSDEAAGYTSVYEFNVEKIVTANNFEVLSTADGEIDYTNNTILTDANSLTNIFLKVYYSGNRLSTKTIDLNLPTNSKFKFLNGASSINLDKDFAGAGISTILTKQGTSTTGEFYDVYQIPIKASKELAEDIVTISAGKQGNFALFETTFGLKSVFVASNDEFIVQTEGENIFTLGENRYAVINNSNVKSELYFGQLISGAFDQSTIANVEMTRLEVDDNFSQYAVDFIALGKIGSVNKFQIWGVQGDKTTRFQASISYYIKDGNTIKEATQKVLEFEIAVYNNVNRIDLNFKSGSSNEVVYINSKYPQAATTTFNFKSMSLIATPSNTIVFSGEDNVIANVNQLKLSCAGDLQAVEIYCGTEKLEIDANGNVLNYLPSLSGEITVKLIKKPELAVKYVTLTLTAYSFDTKLPVSSSVTIDFGEYVPSTGVELSGKQLVNENNTANLYLSFIDVEDGGYAEAEFNAALVYSNVYGQKYDDIDYILYQIQQDDDGNPVLNDGKYSTIELSKADNRLNVDILKAQNRVSLKADKSLGGGIYLLRLVAMDSFNDLTGEYEKYADVVVTITDGSIKARYRIASVEDFKNIKNNLNANYVLTKNLTIDDHTAFGNFSGSLTGKNISYSSSGNIVETERSLKITIVAPTGGTDNFYAGIFAQLKGSASVADLTVDVSFKFEKDITKTDTNNLVYIGGLAGVVEKDVKITNVKLTTNFAGIKLNKDKIQTAVFVGGVAGEFAGSINLSDSPVIAKGGIQASLTSQLNIGGVAGRLTGEVKGNGANLEALKFDLGVSITLDGIDATTINNVNIGGVAGLAEIENSIAPKIDGFVVMGQINASNLRAKGNLAGVVGSANDAQISNIMLVGVNIDATTVTGQTLYAAGVVGSATSSNISNVKFLSFRLEDDLSLSLSIAKNKNLGYVSNVNGIAAGIAANSDATTILCCAVDNFVKNDLFYSLNADTIYGIANKGNIQQCYVRANLKGKENKIYYISGEDQGTVNCYFIGRQSNLAASVSGNKTYIAVIGTMADGSEYLSVNGFPVDFNDYNKDEENKYTITDIDATIWGQQQSFNTVTVNDYTFYFPYLNNNLTLIPTNISTMFDAEYIKGIYSLYNDNYNNNVDTDKRDDENNIIKHQITETVIVNYYNDINNPTNNVTKNIHKLSDLVKLNKVPNHEKTIGAVVYKIVSGGNYASIIGNNQIYFKGVTGANDYILVKAYSVFNPDACDYFLIYTQYLFSDIVIEGNDVQSVGNNYVLDAYKGAQNIELYLNAINARKNDDAVYSNLFDVANIQEFVEIETNIVDNENSIVSISNNPNLFNRFVLSFKDDSDGSSKTESITFKIKFNLTKYFGENIFDYQKDEDDNYILDVNGNKIPQYLEIGTKTLNINISETATDLEFNTEHLEGESKENFAFNATLYTGFVAKYDEKNKPENNTFVEVNAHNNVVEFVENNHDSLVMNFVVKEGAAEYERLLKQAGETNLVDLFDFNVLNTFDASNKTYNYRISIQLKDTYLTRYLTQTIKFGIKVFAKTNSLVDGGTTIDLIINPTRLSSSIVMNNYAATSAESMGNYTHLITSSQIETANITPGGNGGVLAIRMQPSYAYIKQVTLKSSELFVPSLNTNVKVRFEQIILHKGLNKYISISPACDLTDDLLGVKLNLATSTTDGVSYEFDGTIYVHVVLDKKFSGLADEIRLTLDVTNADETHIVKTKSLITDFLPGVDLEFDKNYQTSALIKGKAVEGYLIQQNSTNNIVTVKIYGYQFNANPTVEIEYLDGTGVGTQIDYQWLDKYSELKPNADGSYSMRLKIAVRTNIEQPFKVAVKMSLATNTQITSEAKEINFFPTDYILNVENTKFEFNSVLNLAINQARDLSFVFATNNSNVDYSNEIYKALIESVKAEIKIANPDFDDEQVTNAVYQKLKSLFSYRVDETGKIATFDEDNEYFAVSLTNYGSGADNQTYLRLTAKGKFETIATFKIGYDYVWDNGVFKLKFGTPDQNTYPHMLEISFEINFYTATTRQSAFAISSAEDMFDTSGNCLLGEGQNYVLTDDIVVEIAKPITTKIASLDGNNKKIIIKNFVVETNESESTAYLGLFAEVDASTMLYNIVVDYSQFNTSSNGQLTLAYEGLNEIVFGGLAAVNNGLVYNCDVVNAGSSNKTINLLINNSAATSLTFGGLVGINNGTITNSRVGRSEFTKIIANDNSQTSYTEQFKPLNFVFGNRTTNVGQGFKSIVGGFVGVNNADTAIASSYVANTSLYTYSTNEESKLAGFVAENYGRISYSYVKGLESTITNENPYSTGAKIEAHADANIAGFVYENMSGANINNSFANIELVSKSAFMAGFVFRNNANATIAQCYAACTFTNADSNTSLTITPEQPFVGADTTGLLSFGTLQNCYWYKDETNKQNFIVAEESGKDQATGLNAANFAETSNLINFVFVLSNSKNDRDEGVWSFYNNKGNMVKLPELTNANNVAHSFRYESNTSSEAETKYTYATKFALGTKNNPDTISSVQEFNDAFTKYGSANQFTGYVRFIADIDFANDKTAIQTRRQFTLGNNYGADSLDAKTSVDGNGMTISNIYLDVGEDKEESVGLFAKINQAYVKNLNLNFSAGEFSTANAIYSGGLAGRITDSVIINITLDGVNTTIQGANMVGGMSGLIEGQSLVYGVSSNLSVSTILSNTTELYNSTKQASSTNNSYAKTLSYAGGIVGVADLTSRSYSRENYNLSYLYINDNGVSTNESLTILADYAGGVAGYVGKDVKALRLSFNVGSNNRINGQYSAGGLFAASIGASVEASKVSALDDDEQQFKYDKTLATYVLDMSKDLDTENLGNTGLIESYQYGGGLIGLSVGSTVFSCYSKASFYAGNIIGGLIGLDVMSTYNYNYAVPFINFATGNMEELTYVGGFVGRAEDATSASFGLIYTGLNKKVAGQSYLFSTILLDQNAYSQMVTDLQAEGATYSVKFNNFIADDKVLNHIVSQVYVGNVNYNKAKVSVDATTTTGTITEDISKLYNLDVPDVQLATYTKIFEIWDTKYWNLETNTRYFPLLTDERTNNYDIIKDVSDINKLKNNPTGSFKVINDIDMTGYYGGENFVFDFTFEGVLVGEKADGTTPKLYNLNVKASNSSDDAGLFRGTKGATFRNLEFSWMENGVGYNSSSVNIKNFAAFSAKDEPTRDDNNQSVNTKISAVDITVGRTISDECRNGAELFKTGSSITGFAGLVYEAEGTNIINSGFSGLVSATIASSTAPQVYVGGLIGSGETDSSNPSENTMSLVNCYVGAVQQTKFEFNVNSAKQSSIGVVAGKLTNSAVTGVTVDNVHSTLDRKIGVKITLNTAANANLSVAGLVGLVEDSQIESNTVLTDISLKNAETNSARNVLVAGLIGEYRLSTSNSGRAISNNNVQSIISAENNNLTFASVGVAWLNSSNKTIFEQNVFDGKISTQGNAYVGGVVGYASYNQDENHIALNPNVDDNSVKILIDQVVSNVDIYAEMNNALNANKYFAGGVVGYANGTVTLSNIMNMGKIVPTAEGTKASNVNYNIGGLIGCAKQVVLANSSFTFSLATILTNNLTKDAITHNEDYLNNNFRTIGALFGYLAKTDDSYNMFVGDEENLTKYSTSANKSGLTSDLFYSTDFALVPENTMLGTNLAAGTLINTTGYQQNAIQTGLWANSNSNTYVPYLTSMVSSMRLFGIVDNATNSYAAGSVANPLSGYVNSSNNYYYLVDSNGFNVDSSFKGIAVGTGAVLNSNQFYIGTIDNDSAVSNIHIKYAPQNGESNVNVLKSIVGTNNGVMFNCSISGYVDEVQSAMGLLVNNNNGMLSYSNSSADIKSTVSVSALTNTNRGTINSCYVSGNITIKANSNAVGYAFAATSETTNNYIYNSYVSSYINSIAENGSSMTGNKSETYGSNNYIDGLSTPKNEFKSAQDYVTLVQTAVLMENTNNMLTGNWFTTINEQKLNKASTTFAYNYNYPVYNFNKYAIEAEGEELKVQNLVNVRQTGSGEQNNKFQVSTLGVLASVQGLLDKQTKYFKLTHDLDGNIKLVKDNNGVVSEISNINWTAVGLNSIVGGFAAADTGFNGNFDASIENVSASENDKHIIANLNANGLFANLNNATISNLKLEGIFDNLKNSGALGISVSGAVQVTNVDVSALEVIGSEKLGVLFGSIELQNGQSGLVNIGEENGKIGVITAFGGSAQTSIDAQVATVTNKGQSTVGLIAATNAGEINVFNGDEDLNIKFNTTYDAVCGGLVGENSGSIAANQSDTKIIIQTSANHNIIGGLTGLATDGSISNFTVMFDFADIEMPILTASIFGGLVGKATGSIELTSCAINEERCEMLYIFGNIYFGLVVGELSGNGKLSLDTSLKISSTYCGVSSIGFGGIVGIMDNKNCGIYVTGSLEEFAPVLASQSTSAESSTNGIGGLIGQYVCTGNSKEGDAEDVATGGEIQFGSKPGNIIISGTTNVGGAIGYADAIVTIKQGTWDMLTAGTKFATLKTILGASATNWGGLIGKAGSNLQLKGAKNANPIEFGEIDVNGWTSDSITIKNIGGIVGYTDGLVENCQNKADITLNNANRSIINDTMYEQAYNVGLKNGAQKTTLMSQPMNVGGIVGKVAGNGRIVNCENSSKVQGYQNVGGIAGYNMGTILGSVDIVEFDQSGNITTDIAEDETIYKLTLVENVYTYSEVNKDEVQYAEDITYYVKNAENNSSINNDVVGAINVGGVVGYTSNNSKVWAINSEANVAGNTNVGGVAGLAGDNASIANTNAGKVAQPGEEEKQIVVNGLFVHNVVTSTIGVETTIKSYYVLPTSVGGLIGSTANNAVDIRKNTVNAQITSPVEGDTDSPSSTTGDNMGSNVVSTISNFMFNNVDVDNVNNIDVIETTSNTKDEIEKKKIQFNDIKTGWGGLIGTTSSNTALNGLTTSEDIAKANITTNKIKTTANTGVGINVGAYFGYYKVGSGVNDGSRSIALPELSNDSSVGGVYNIGGAIGCVETGNVKLSYQYNPLNKIDVQPTGVGMYVGGVFGKVKGEIDGLTANSNVVISTNNSYYIGGLIGRLEGNLTNANATQITVIGENLAKNFGGLVGMLKVAKVAGGTTATVKGEHNFAFTINTIENQNYFDAESKYEAMEDEENNEVTLHAIATYVNQDKFNISASKTDYDHNPIYNDTVDGKYTTQGWHKNYTGFKTMQRCVPMSENNGALWDNITSIYEAANITAVKTGDDGNIEYTIYEAYPEVPMIYTMYGWGKIYYNSTDSGKLSYQKPSIGEENEDYIKVSDYYANNLKDGDENKNEFIDSVYFEYKVKYNENKLSNSGSILEVNGASLDAFSSVSERETQEDLKKNLQNTHRTLTTISTIADIVSIVIIIATWGTGSAAAAGGSAMLKGGGKVAAETGIKAWIKRKVQKVFNKTILKKIFGVLLVMAIKNTVSLHMKNLEDQMKAFNSTGLIVQNVTNETYGYISTMYYRNLVFNDGEMATLSDSTVVIDGQIYQLYSTVRPSDYYANLWMGYNASIEQVTEYKPTKDQITPGLEAYKKYEYKDGYYWINALCCELINIPTSLFGSSQYAVSGQNKMPYVFNSAGRNYVYGKYENGKYQFEARDDGNKVVYDNGKYTLNDVVLDESEVEVMQTLRFKYDASAEADSFKVKGYDHIKGVYYTVSGNNTNGLIKYGLFTETASPIGVENIDWIQKLSVKFKLVEGELLSSDIGKTYYQTSTGGDPFIYNGANRPAGDIYERIQSFKKYQLTAVQDTPFDNVAETQTTQNLYPYSFTNPYTIDISGADLAGIYNADAIYVYTTESTGIQVNVKYYLWEGGYANNNIVAEKPESKKVYLAQNSYAVSSRVGGAAIPDDLSKLLEQASKIPFDDGTSISVETIYKNASVYANKTIYGETFGENYKVDIVKDYLLYTVYDTTTSGSYRVVYSGTNEKEAKKYIDSSNKETYTYTDSSTGEEITTNKYNANHTLIKSYIYDLSKYDPSYILGDDGLLYKVVVSYSGNENLEEMNYNKYLNVGGEFVAQNKIYTRYKFKDLPNDFMSYKYGDEDALNDYISKLGNRVINAPNFDDFIFRSETHNGVKNTYKFYTENGDPNTTSGFSTKFCESARIIMSGSFFKYTGTWMESAKAGSFNIE